MRAPRIVVVICAIALLALPAVARGKGQAAVTGEVFFLEMMALPPTAKVNVQLQDVSRADAAATVIAEQTIDGNQGPPYAFTLTLPALCAARKMMCVAPETRKALAVHDALRGPVATSCPASFLRKQPQCTLLLDTDSAAKL